MMLGMPTLSAPVVDAATAGGAFSYAWLMVALPLLGAAVLLLAGRRANAWGHWLGVLASAGSFVVGLLVIVQLMGLDPDERVVGVPRCCWRATAGGSPWISSTCGLPS